ncbi:hypothetical protein NEAUS04_0272 [Nematocida ausubeli]|nr:hypothetical protein NEAUS04_0272 [Nematocida ausubeli]
MGNSHLVHIARRIYIISVQEYTDLMCKNRLNIQKYTDIVVFKRIYIVFKKNSIFLSCYKFCYLFYYLFCYKFYYIFFYKFYYKSMEEMGKIFTIHKSTSTSVIMYITRNMYISSVYYRKNVYSLF